MARSKSSPEVNAFLKQAYAPFWMATSWSPRCELLVSISTAMFGLLAIGIKSTKYSEARVVRQFKRKDYTIDPLKKTVERQPRLSIGGFQYPIVRRAALQFLNEDCSLSIIWINEQNSGGGKIAVCRAYLALQGAHSNSKSTATTTTTALLRTTPLSATSATSPSSLAASYFPQTIFIDSISLAISSLPRFITRCPGSKGQLRPPKICILICPYGRIGSHYYAFDIIRPILIPNVL